MHLWKPGQGSNSGQPKSLDDRFRCHCSKAWRSASHWLPEGLGSYHSWGWSVESCCEAEDSEVSKQDVRQPGRAASVRVHSGDASDFR